MGVIVIGGAALGFLWGLIYMVTHAIEAPGFGELIAPYLFMLFFSFSPVVLAKKMNMDTRTAWGLFKLAFAVLTFFLIIQLVIFWSRLLFGTLG